MDPMTLAGTLLALLPAQREPLLEAAPRARTVTRADVADDKALAQMVDGFLAVLEEDLSGKPPDKRVFFLDTVIPSLVDAGVDPHATTEGSIYFAVIAAIGLIEACPADVRRDARIRVGRFMASYTADIARIAWAKK